MKDNRFIIMIGSIMSIFTLLFMIFMVATIFSSTLDKEARENLSSSIALFSVFATFGGALIGTLLAGYISKKQLMDMFEKDRNKENFKSFYIENEKLLYQMYNENIDKINDDLKELISDYYETKNFADEEHKKIVEILGCYLNFLTRRESGNLLYNATLDSINNKIFHLIDSYDVEKKFVYLREILIFKKASNWPIDCIIAEIENIVNLYEKLPVTNINKLKIDKLFNIDEYIN